MPPEVKLISDSPEGRGLDPVAAAPKLNALKDPPLLLVLWLALTPSTLRIEGAGELTREMGRNGGVEGGVVIEGLDL